MSKLLLLPLSLLLTPLAFVTVPKENVTIVMEAESYATIEEPMRVVRDATGVSGDAFVEVPLGAGQGWRGEGSGGMTYRVDLPSPGDYRLWGRALWKDGCTNALFIKANKGPKLVFGNDAIFERWHWVKGQVLHLEKGVNYVSFANHSDGTALDKLILTNNPLFLPEGLGRGITRFYDGFAGCDADNTGSWEQSSGNWRVVRGVGQGAGVNDCLAQWMPDGGLALGGFRNWHNYDAHMKVMLSAPGSVGLIFFRADADNEMRLIFEAGEERGVLRLLQTASGNNTVLGEAETPVCRFDSWYELGFRHIDGSLVCMLDGEPTLTVPWPDDDDQTGQVGLTTNIGGVYYDNVDVRFLDS